MKEQEFKVLENDNDIRLDRWFKRYLPEIPQSLLQKLLRKGDIRVNGKKLKANHHVLKNQVITLRANLTNIEKRENTKSNSTKADAEKYLLNNIIYQDKNIIAINKPYGLAVQGGTKVKLCVDDMLGFLDNPKPKLVHRLDKDTSGVLLIARSRHAASTLTNAFKSKEFQKVYWAIVVGVPEQKRGEINLPLKIGLSEDERGRREKTEVDMENGKKATTRYRVLEKVSNKLALVELTPLSGRKHQLRAHMEAIGYPILGDGKYASNDAFIEGLGKKLHLHARSISHKSILGINLNITADIPPHIAESWELLEFENDYPIEDCCFR